MTITKLNGTFLQVVYSAKSGVEGFLLRVSGQPVQVIVDKQDEKTAHLMGGLVAGQAIIVATQDRPPSDKGDGEHPVHAFQKLVSVDGALPPRAAAKGAGYAGKIVRFNYAKHGAPNGYVLDGGDFIHVKPDGFTKLKLTVGDRVEADGDAHFLATGNGWAVEAAKVNGKSLK